MVAVFLLAIRLCKSLRSPVLHAAPKIAKTQRRVACSYFMTILQLFTLSRAVGVVAPPCPGGQAACLGRQHSSPSRIADSSRSEFPLVFWHQISNVFLPSRAVGVDALLRFLTEVRARCTESWQDELSPNRESSGNSRPRSTENSGGSSCSSPVWLKFLLSCRSVSLAERTVDCQTQFINRVHVIPIVRQRLPPGMQTTSKQSLPPCCTHAFQQCVMETESR